jgi:1,4-alpha-glucan branching enzyme
MPAAYLSLILHAHLPYIRRAGRDASFEERWLFEGVIQCYLPLLRVFEGLVRDGIRARFTLSVSPTLAEMLADPLLMDRCARHLAALADLAARETVRTRADARFHRLAVAHRTELDALAADFESRGRRLLPSFAALRDAGLLDLVTTAATHGHLPLLGTVPSASRAQVRLGAESHRRTFGAASDGFWPPELAYRPGLERDFSAAGARWFCVETHGLLRADARPYFGTFAPVACPNGVAAFARDPDLARRVWDARLGYPGDPWYREYHRDIGYELAPGHLGPLAAPPGTRGPTGIKYHRVTGPAEDKRPYEPDRAAARVDEHAADFVRRAAARCAAAAPALDRPPQVTAPFDAELFGHWWHEGPAWLDAVARLSDGSGILELITPTGYLDRHPRLQRATPAESSWGAGGGHETWLHESTAWIWPRLHDAARRMQLMAEELRRTSNAEPESQQPTTNSQQPTANSRRLMAGDGQSPSSGCTASSPRNPLRSPDPRLPSPGSRLPALGPRPSAPGPPTSALRPPPSDLVARAARQAARHLLLAQASDWPFMIRNGRAADFAARMVRDHLRRFDYLEHAVRRGRVNPRRLAEIERETPLFAALETDGFAG